MAVTKTALPSYCSLPLNTITHKTLIMVYRLIPYAISIIERMLFHGLELDENGWEMLLQGLKEREKKKKRERESETERQK